MKGSPASGGNGRSSKADEAPDRSVGRFGYTTARSARCDSVISGYFKEFEMFRRSGLPAFLVFAALALVPSAALAQASITGVVKDASGAVLPGVTVEAASPVLIEK